MHACLEPEARAQALDEEAAKNFSQRQLQVLRLKHLFTLPNAPSPRTHGRPFAVVLNSTSEMGIFQFSGKLPMSLLVLERRMLSRPTALDPTRSAVV